MKWWEYWPWKRDARVAELEAKLAVVEMEREQLANLNEALRQLILANLGYAKNVAMACGVTTDLPSQVPMESVKMAR